MVKTKPIPKFKSEDQEAQFWATHDVTDYFNFQDPQARIKGEFVNLKPSTKTITIRVPEWLLNSLKVLANKKDIPYQSLMKVILSEKVEAELYPAKPHRKTTLSPS
jgi:predicted DNA binding CopG/RHH family protein